MIERRNVLTCDGFDGFDLEKFVGLWGTSALYTHAAVHHFTWVNKLGGKSTLTHIQVLFFKTSHIHIFPIVSQQFIFKHTGQPQFEIEEHIPASCDVVWTN